MASDTKGKERWRFSTSVMLPVAAAMLLTAATVLGFVLWTTSAIDERALGRQLQMMGNAMTAQRIGMIHDQQSVTVWDEAAVRLRDEFDAEWVHHAMGQWMHAYFGHAVAAVLDGQGEPLYMMRAGESVDPAEYRAIAPAVRPLVTRLRAGLARGGTEPMREALGLADFGVIEGRPAVVGVAAIVSQGAHVPAPGGTEMVHVSIKFLDEELANELRRNLLFEDVSFPGSAERAADRASFAITNSAGRFVGIVSWTPERPGRTLLSQTAPALGGAFVVASLLVLMLLRQLWTSSSELRAGRLHAERMARYDRLTGLPNRNQFDEHLAEALSRQREGDAQVSLMMLDLDRFKQVNDTLGHQAGDSLIRSVGARLNQLLGPGDSLARLGGDEFAIVHLGSSTEAEVETLSERIIEAVAQPFSFGLYKAFVGVSIGIVTAAQGGSDPREMIRKADIALYEAKAAGRNRAVVYQERMNELLQLQRTIEGELREALQRDDQLTVVFQPLVDQESRRTLGAEALVRWNHPKYGQISPVRFIPVAENTGQIEALGEFVLRKACEVGARAPGRTMAVNISPTQLRNPLFARQVMDTLVETGMRANDLELEITESILLDDEQISSQTLHTLRASGIHIALDDFGTGYSSLSYLKRYPVDRIKIDRSFINQLSEGHASVAIVQAIVTLAHAMNIQVTAEGVETEEQAEILARLGCNVFQGYLFSAAVSSETILARFADPAHAPPRRPRRERVA